MKNLAAVLLFVIACLMLACSDDKSTEPDPPDETLLTSQTIGASGGELTHDDFTLSVPEGAFNTTASVSLYETDADHGFGDNAISPLYRLDGLPETFAESLTVRIVCTGATTEESFVLFGDVTDDAAIELLPASASGGTMYVTIPPRSAGPSVDLFELGKRSVSVAGQDYVAAIANFRTDYETDLFKISYPAYLIDYIDDLVSYTNEAKAGIEGLGMSFETGYWERPVALVIKPLVSASGKSFVRMRIDPKNEKPPKIIVDESKLELSSLPRLRIVMQLATMYLAQAGYGPDDILDDEYVWWHEAVRRWFPAVTLGTTLYPKPDSLPGYERAPFDGMFAGAENYSGYRQHGYGMSSFIRYLEQKHGSTVIGDIYVQLALSNSMYDALLTGAGADVYNWLPEFFDRYLSGNYYGVTATDLLSRITGTFTIDNDADTLESFLRGCPELGAQIYRINLSHPTISTNASILFELKGTDINPDYLTVLVYKYKDNLLEYVTAGNEISVGGLRELTEDGYDLIAVVVNSYYDAGYPSSSTLELTVTVKSTPVFSQCQIRIGVTATFQKDGDTTKYEGLITPGWGASGETVGNTFSGPLDADAFHGGTNTTGTMTVTIDPVTLRVASFAANATTTDAWGISRWSVAGGGVEQHNYFPGHSLVCEENGADACVAITSFVWTSEPNGQPIERIVSYRCESTAGVRLTLWQ